MNINTLRVIPLALLMSAIAPVAVALAPVSELGGGNAVERLERMLDARNQMQLDMQRQLDHMARELDNLRGTVEKHGFEINQMLDRQRDIYQEIDTLRKDSAIPVSIIAKKNKGPSPEAISNDQVENEQYDAAVDLILRDKNYRGAASAFNAFLEQYPNSVYKPNAHYWLGQLYFSTGDLTAAKQHFTEVSQFSDSSKRADALLKLGMIAKKQGDVVTANRLFQQIVDSYANSTTANQAEKELQRK